MKTDGAPQRSAVDALLAAAAALVYEHGHAPGAFPGLCPVRGRCPHLAGRSGRTLGAWAAVVGLMILGVGFMGGEAHSARGGPNRIIYVPDARVAMAVRDGLEIETMISGMAQNAQVVAVDGFGFGGEQVWVITQDAGQVAASRFLAPPQSKRMTWFLLHVADAFMALAVEYGRPLGRAVVHAGGRDLEVDRWAVGLPEFGEVVYSRWEPPSR